MDVLATAAVVLHKGVSFLYGTHERMVQGSMGLVHRKGNRISPIVRIIQVFNL